MGKSEGFNLYYQLSEDHKNLEMSFLLLKIFERGQNDIFFTFETASSKLHLTSAANRHM